MTRVRRNKIPQREIPPWVKYLSMILFGSLGWIVVPTHILIRLLLLVIGYNIPLFIDYLRMDTKRLLKFHRGDYRIERKLTKNELLYFGERMINGQLILQLIPDDKDNTDPSWVVINSSIWDTLSDEEKEIFRYLITQLSELVGLEFKGLEFFEPLEFMDMVKKSAQKQTSTTTSNRFTDSHSISIPSLKETLAKQQQSDEYYRKGRDFLFGKGVPKNQDQGKILIELSAKAGDSRAQNLLSMCYGAGMGTKIDRVKSYAWSHIALQNKDRLDPKLANSIQTDFYTKKRDLTKAQKEEAEWLSSPSGNKLLLEGKKVIPIWNESAQNNDDEAQLNLGYCYFFGYEVDRVKEMATGFWEKSGGNGNPSAQYILGFVYSIGDDDVPDNLYNLGCRGRGIPVDYKKAVYWLRRASEQGHAKAQTKLGSFFHSGIEVPKDESEAIRLWRLGAKQGCAKAQSIIGGNYCEGDDKDYVYAYAWLQAAETNGCADLHRVKAIIQTEMTNTQLLEANNLAEKILEEGKVPADAF